MHTKNTRYVSIKIVKEKVFNSKIELLFPFSYLGALFNRKGIVSVILHLQGEIAIQELLCTEYFTKCQNYTFLFSTDKQLLPSRLYSLMNLLLIQQNLSTLLSPGFSGN